MAEATARGYRVNARSTDTFGRVLCSTRNHHIIVDGPIQNGCPGEEITPAELFLMGICACGVELVQSLAKEAKYALQTVAVEISGVLDRANPVRKDLSVFNSVQVRFQLAGVSAAEGDDLITRFKGR